jgi:tellurite methyltransferase
MSNIGLFYDMAYTVTGWMLGGPPDMEVAHAVRLVPTGSKVLDIGCGYGRHSLFLAHIGLKVKAIDASEVGIEILKEDAQEQKLEIETVVGDIKHELLDDDHSLITCNLVLHNHSLETGTWIVSRMKDKVHPGGINVITTYAKGCYLEEDPFTPEWYFYRLEELTNLYRDWNILYSGIRMDDSSKGIRAAPVMGIIAQKPK